jgi:hypothetical protein
MRSAIKLSLLGAITAIVGAAVDSDRINVDHPAIAYTARESHDPVAELSRKVKSGEVTLRFDENRGYLPAILDELKIPVESQMAVFSKTSVQSIRIDPAHPRVLYFNDSVAVGWVPRGSIELAALDPKQGIHFYSVDQRGWTTAGGRTDIFQPRTDCLHCHISGATGGVPGLILRSVHTTSDGTPRRLPPGIDTDLRTPFEKLWGGWYVTGDSGSAHHRGAAPAFDTAPYLSPHSDTVALLVFAHQARVTNLLIEAGWRARVGSARAAEVARDLADALLFVGDAPLPDRIQGTSGFAAKFSAGDPLRQFDLEHKLMRSRCSYMIQSPAFKALPADVREIVSRRMADVMQGWPEDERAKCRSAMRK